MGKPGPVRVKLDELLADGEWYDRAPVIAALVPHVPPGKAVRVAAADRRRGDRKRRANGVPAIPANGRRKDDQQVGARDVARETIQTAYARGAIERRTIDGRIEIRKSPPKGTP